MTLTGVSPLTTVDDSESLYGPLLSLADPESLEFIQGVPDAILSQIYPEFAGLAPFGAAATDILTFCNHFSELLSTVTAADKRNQYKDVDSLMHKSLVGRMNGSVSPSAGIFTSSYQFDGKKEFDNSVNLLGDRVLEKTPRIFKGPTKEGTIMRTLATFRLVSYAYLIVNYSKDEPEWSLPSEKMIAAWEEFCKTENEHSKLNLSWLNVEGTL